MAVQVQFRRGTKPQHDAFTGATAEVTINTTDITAHVHDGTTAGGFPLARADATNLDLSGLAGVTTVTSVAIHGGTVNNTTIGIGTSANGNFTNVNIVDGQVGSALTVGAATTFKEDLVVNGNARITGILTVGTGTIQIDGDNSTISGVDGGTFTDVTSTTTDTQSLRAVAGVVTTLTSTNATITDLNVTADVRVGSALTVTGNTDLNGNLDVQGNLTVQGSVTTIESTTVTVDDKNIELGSVDSPTDTTANGGGITLKGSTDKTITWQSDTGGWEVNQDFLPSADGTYDLGASGQEWQDLYVDGTANIDSLVADTADINAGTIDGTTIGGSSAAEGTFTNLTAADANITADARVGAALTVTGTATFQSNVDLGDDDRLRFGDGQDLQIFHNSANNNSIIQETGNGDLIIAGNNVHIRNADASENYAKFIRDEGVELYYDNSKKFETTAYGIDVTGTTGTDGLIVSGVTTTTGTLDANGNVTVAGTIDVDGQAIFDDITVSAASTFAGNATFQGNVFLGDNDTINLGDGNDLQIYHSGSNSFIQDSGTGGIFITGSTIRLRNQGNTEDALLYTENDSVELYYDGSKTFETTAYGVDVTGTTGTDNLAVSGVSTFTGTIDVDGQAIFDDITVSAASTFTGAIDANGGANIAGGLVANSVQVSDLTDNRVVLAGTSGELEDSGNLTFDGTTLAVTGNQTISGTIDVDGQAIFDDITVSAAATVTGALDVNGGADISGGETVLSSATVSDLTDNRVVLAGTSGALEDSANLTFDGTTLAVTGNQTVSGTIDVDGQAIFDDITVSAAATIATIDATNATIDNLTFTSGTAITSVDTDLSSVSTSDDTLASAKAIKTYVDAQVTAQDLDFAGGTGTGAVDLDSQTLTIAGTTNEIETSASGQTLTIGLPDNVTITQDLTVDRDIIVGRNLEVTGNVTIGGTSATIFAEELTISNPDITLGFRTDPNTGEDISNDTTANHGGVSVASTEGTPLVSLYNPGIGESAPATYKKFMWFKTGAFSGLGTDAWLANYAIGIGSTQVPNNVVLAAGAVNITNNDISYVRDVTIARNSTVGGTFGVTGTTTLTGALVANGNVDLGNATSDTITATGRFDSSLVPSTDNARDLGASGLEWRNLYIDGTANIDSLVADTADINAGTIDNTTIGGSSASPGTFTNLTAQGNVQLGDSSADTITYYGRVGTDIVPSPSNTYDLGRSGNIWAQVWAGQVTAGNIQIDVTANEIDTSSGNLTIDSAGGTTTIDDILSVSGNATFSGTIDVDGQAIFDDITVSAASTFAGDITANGNIVGDDSTNISGISSVTASTFFGDGSGLSNTGATLSAASGSQRVVLTSLTSGTMTSAATEAALAYNATSDTLTAGTFSGSGASLTSIPNGALDNSTISGVSLGSNLNTLTMGVSGTGLSGSQTYNGSGAATFTVTSNATNSNTASTIVARDSSGNFSAGTITAALSGNATTATTATNANNINVADESSDTTCNVVFTTGATGNLAPKTGTNLTFNSSNGTLTATTFSGSGASLTSIPNGALSNSTISGVSLGSNLNTLTRGSYLTGSNYNGSSATTWAVDATNANTASKIVARDSSGNFSAGTITANLTGNVTGNADTATSATRITLTDQSADTTCSVVFCQSATGNQLPHTGSNLTFNSANGTLSATTFSGSGASLTSLNASNISSGTIAAARVPTLNQSTTGNAATATTLQTARNINGVSFNGSANITVEPYIEDDNSTNATRYMVFTDNSSAGYKRLNEDSSLTYNPSTNTLTAGTVTATSDIKLKENVTTIENGLDKVSQLRGVEFDFKSNGQHSLGVIAQEVEQVLPDLVSEVDGTKTVAYANLTAVLIEAVKELKAEVAELRARLDD